MSRLAIVALLTALLTAVTFSPVLQNGFISIDDPAYVTRNRHVLEGLSAAGLRWAFTTFHAGNWHPLTWLSHMTDATLFGVRPAAHHMASLAIHLLAVAALLKALEAMTGSLWPSAAVTALFAIHPLHVESVAWAAERKDLLCGLLFILALGAYTRYLRAPKVTSYLVVCGALALALLAKPMAVTAPFVLVLLDYWPFGRISSWRSLAARLAEKAPLLLMSAASAAVTYAAQSAGGWVKSGVRYPLAGRLANGLYSCMTYLRKTFWPVDLAMPYGYPDGLSPETVLACFLMVAAVTSLVVAGARRAPYAAVGWLWFLGMLVPVAGIVQVGDQGMADRYMYLPVVGIFLTLTWGLRAIARNGGARQAAVILFVAFAVAACAPLTWRQAGYWRSDLTLFTHAMKVTPRNWLAHDNYGASLIEAGRYIEATAIYQELLANGKAYPSVLNNLGVLAMYRGDYAEAEARLRQAIALRPGYGRAHFNLGSLYMRQGRAADAARSYERAAALGVARSVSQQSAAPASP